MQTKTFPQETECNISRIYFVFQVILSPLQLESYYEIMVLGLATVNLEIFARILFLRIALKDIFEKLKIRDFDMIYLHQ